MLRKKLAILLISLALLTAGCSESETAKNPAGLGNPAETARLAPRGGAPGMKLTPDRAEAAENAPIGALLEATAAYRRWELRVDSPGGELYGELYLPSRAAAPYPTVILSHGLGGTCEGGRRYAAEFAKIGVATYCFDYRGVSENSRSRGLRTTEMSILTVEADLNAVLAASENWSTVDNGNVFLMGYSLGGLASALTAPAHEGRLRAEILFYPAFSIRDSARQMAASEGGIPGTFRLGGVPLGAKCMEDVLDYDLYGRAEKFTKNVLLLHGTKDDVVGISYSEELRSRLASVQYHVVEGGAHSFQGGHFAEAMGIVTAFLKKEIQ